MLVSRPYALSTPHAWALCDLGFPLLLGIWLITGVFLRTHLSWPHLAVWITDARCHIGLTLLLRTRRHILVIDIRPLIGTLSRTACGTPARVACGTQPTWPIITSSQRCPRTGRYTSPPSLELLTCSAKRLSHRPWRPMWYCVKGHKQYAKVTSLHTRFSLRTRGWINDHDLLSLALLCLH